MKTKTKPKSLSLQNASTEAKLLALQRDNFYVGNKGEWGLMSDTEMVYLSQQKIGQTRTQEFSIPKRFFDQLVAFYVGEQEPLPPSSR